VNPKIVRRIEVIWNNSNGRNGEHWSALFDAATGPISINHSGLHPLLVECVNELVRVAWELGREAGKVEAGK
jgi:hypothetical protein